MKTNILKKVDSSLMLRMTTYREVRNRIEKKKSDSLNLVLRWYKSSAGQECSISFEDEL